MSYTRRGGTSSRAKGRRPPEGMRPSRNYLSNVLLPINRTGHPIRRSRRSGASVTPHPLTFRGVGDLDDSYSRRSASLAVRLRCDEMQFPHDGDPMTFEHRQRDVFDMGAAEAHGSKATPHSAAAAFPRQTGRRCGYAKPASTRSKLLNKRCVTSRIRANAKAGV